MKTISAAMATHVGKTTTTLTTCIRVERIDGEILTVTSFNRALTIDAEIYAPLGLLRQDVSSEPDMGVGTTEATGILDDDSLTEDSIRAGRWDYAAYSLFMVNWNDLSMGRINQSSGNLGVCRSGRIKFVVELLTLLQALQNGIGNLNSAACIHDFGMSRGGPGLGNGCTFDLATVTFTGVVDSTSSSFYVVTDAARTEAIGYFSNGTFRLTSGVMSGMEFEIRAHHAVGSWTLFTALPYSATGASYEIVRGCNKSLRQCVDDYDNILDRLASDYTQGGDVAVQVARHGQQNTSGGSVPGGGAPATPGVPNPVNVVMAWDGSNSPHHTSGVVVGDTYVVQFTTDSDPIGPGNIDVGEYGDPATYRNAVISTNTAGTAPLPNGTQLGNSVSFIFGSSAGQVNLAASTTYYLIVRMPSPPSTIGDNCDMVISF